MILKILDISENVILSGAVQGKAAFASLVAKAGSDPADPSALFLDFDGIELATASYMREAVSNLKSYFRATKSKHYPVLANISSEIEEEVFVLMEARKDAIVVCDLDHLGAPKNARTVGNLDPKQAVTYDIVNQLHEADAGTLMEKFGEAESTKSTTAWNNRLSGLAQRGLLKEYSRGRAKYYRTLIEVTS